MNLNRYLAEVLRTHDEGRCVDVRSMHGLNEVDTRKVFHNVVEGNVSNRVIGLLVGTKDVF